MALATAPLVHVLRCAGGVEPYWAPPPHHRTARGSGTHETTHVSERTGCFYICFNTQNICFNTQNPFPRSVNSTRGAPPPGKRLLKVARTFGTMIAAPSAVSPGGYSGSLGASRAHISGAIMTFFFYNPYHHTVYEYAPNDNIFGLSEFLGEETPAREGR